MSDPTGQGTTPEKPTFSGPEGYGTTTVAVKSYGTETYAPAEEKAPHVLKGVSAGTFVPKNQSTIDSVKFTLPPNKPEPRPRRVGAEVRNPEQEELIRLGKLAKQGGLTFDVDAEGNVESINLPPEFAGDEESLRLELLQQKEEAGILRELIPLSLLFTENDKDADFLKPKLQNPATVAAIESLSEELKRLIQKVHAKPEGTKLDEIRQKLADFEKVVERAQSEASRIPVPPPTSAPTPAPTAAPKPPEPLREYGGWPTSDVFYRKQTKNTPGGWFSKTRPNEPLHEQEAWDNENKAFDIVYRRYIDFIKNMKLSEKQLVRPLIDAKNKVTAAVRSEDVTLVSSMREEFERGLEEWEKRWKILSRLKEGEKKLEELKKKTSGVLANIETEIESENLMRKLNDITTAIERAREAILNGDEYDLEKISSMIEKYEETIKRHETTGKELKRNILRPIRATEKNRDQKIKLIDGREPTVGEYTAELEAAQQEENRITITQQDLADWPELRAAGYQEGDPLDKKAFEKFQSVAKYARMLERNENAFLSLYTTPSVNPNTHEVVYTETETLRKHPQRNIIKEVLREMKNIDIVHLTRSELKNEENKKKEGEYLKRTELGRTYNPRLDLNRPFLGRPKKTEISNEEGMQTNSKRKPVQMAVAMGNELKPEPVLGSHLTPEQETKRQEALRKVSAVMKARENWFTKNPKNNLQDKRMSLWHILGIGIFALGVAATVNQRGGETVPVPAGPTVSAPDSRKEAAAETHVEKKADWRRGIETEEKRTFLKDFTSLSLEDLAVKYAPLYADKNNPSSIAEFLKMDGYTLLNYPGPCYGLDDDQRNQACRFIRLMESISQAVDAPAQSAALDRHMPFDHPSNWYMTPRVTIRDYYNTLGTKIAQADK
jgi:hypothetical protein